MIDALNVTIYWTFFTSILDNRCDGFYKQFIHYLQQFT